MRRALFRIIFLTSYIFLAMVGKLVAQTNVLKNKPISNYRFGALIGNAYLITKNIDGKINNLDGEVYEFLPSAEIGVYRNLNSRVEVGLNLRHGEMETLLSIPNTASRCIFDELQVVFQWSLNRNAGLNQGKFTINARGSLGINNFKSKYFTYFPTDTTHLRVISSVGYPRTDWDLFEAKRRNVLVVGAGITFGYRLTKQFSLFYESNYQLVGTTKMKGDLSTGRGDFADTYWFNSIGLFIRFLPPPNKLRCPGLR